MSENITAEENRIDEEHIEENRIDEEHIEENRIDEEHISVAENHDAVTTEEAELPVQKSGLGKEVLVSLLSFLVPAAIFAAAWASQGITWNGKVTPLTYDMQKQYEPMLASLRYIINGEASVFYNWNLGLGGNYFALFAYYLASPLNFITVFFSLQDMPNAIYLLTLLKIGLCGLTFSIYLRFGLKKTNTSYFNIIFACCYALMSYNMLYALCIMWLDSIILLPIVLLGIEKIFEGKRGAFYCLAIGATFFTNFYLSYMAGIFAALYLLGGLIIRVNKKNIKEMFLYACRFAYATIIGFFLSGILLIPALLVYFSTGNPNLTSETADPSMYQFGLLEVCMKLLPQQYDSIAYGGRPLLYCGTLMILLCLFFFLQKRRLREKVCLFLALLFYVIGFVVPEVDYSLHGFRIPHCFLYRYSFAFSTLVIIGAYLAFQRIKYENKYAKLLIGMGAVYLLLELYLNGAVIIAGLNTEMTYAVRNAYAKPESVYEQLAELIVSDRAFSRTAEGANVRYTHDNAIKYNLRGTDASSSTYNYYADHFLRSMGGLGYIGFGTSSDKVSQMIDTLLGIRYRIDTVLPDEGYEVLEESTDYPYYSYLFQNPQALSVAYAIPTEAAFELDNAQEDIFKNRNDLFTTLGDTEETVYTAVACEPVGEATSQKLQAKITVTDDKEVYVFINAELDIDLVQSILNDKEQEQIDIAILLDGEERQKINLNTNYNTDLRMKYCSLGSSLGIGDHIVTILTPERCGLSTINFWSYHRDRYEKVYESLTNHQMTVTDYGPDWLEGTICIGEGEKLFASIPYEKGMQARVDGEKVETASDVEPFITIEMSPGEHTIRFEYQQPGLKAGIISFTAGMTLFLLFYAVFPRVQRKKSRIS